MKVGDYVRTKKRGFQYPQIAQIKSMSKDSGYKNQYFIELDHNLLPDYEYRIYKEDIAKSSPNILDLIEPWDLLYIDIEYGFAGGLVVPRIYETQAELDEAIERIKNDEERELVGIVTHEQLENMMYEVKNND